ncbi:MAG: putative Ig domain-containing protein, partial [Candidatus Omnitrophota bacterium]|nr:putative Ig domain-containing protein [Candidatus Omnitrophota bacterium]
DGRSEEAIDFEPVAGQPNPLPRGASFDVSTHRFTWTPDYSQAGSYPGIRFIVTEDTAEKRSDYEDIAITVNNVSKPPVLDPIGNKTVSEMGLLNFTISASDPEGDALTYSASNLPTGASFNAATRTFSWAPTYQQSGIYSKVRFEVTDGASGGSGGGDTNTKLLMHLNSETGFTDTSASPHAVTKYGGASIDTAVKKFGTGSLTLDGSSGYLSAANNGDWDFGLGDFTIDWWEYRTRNTGASIIRNASSTYPAFILGYNNVGGTLDIYMSSNGSGWDVAGGRSLGPVTLNGWHHYAVVRNGNNFYAFKDGIQTDTWTSSASLKTNSNPLSIGRYLSTYFQGSLDEIRVSKGIARWTSNFTPAAAEYSGSGGGSDGNIDYEEITITVLDMNLTPVLNPIGNKAGSEGSLLSFVIAGTDDDGDALTYSAANLPSGAAFNAQTRTFSWTPTYTQAGTYSVVHFEVTDGKVIDSEDIAIVVSNTNMAPVLASIGNKAVSENSLLEFAISASDNDGDALTYSAANLPSGASFNTATHVFSWTPGYTAAGSYSNVTFTVSDGSAADSETITITVNNTNRKPVINSLSATPSLDVGEGENITIAIDVSDPDGDTLSYFVQNEPEGSGFVNNDFYWTPDYTQAGVYSDVTFTVYDGALYSDPQAVTITVANTNDAPVFIGTPAKIASYGGYGEAKSVGARGDYAYVAYADGKLKALDISNLRDIREVSAITTYRDLTRLEISGSEIYLVDSGSLVSIVDIAVPSWFYARGNMPEITALDTALYENTAYIACGENLALYDITDRNTPVKIEGFDFGKADKIITKDAYAYAISADEDLKVIDTAANLVISLKNFQGGEGYRPTDIAVSGNNLYIAKGAYGIVCFDIQDPASPKENGEYYIYGTTMAEIRPYNKDRIFILGASSGNYSLTYLDSGDPTLMAVLWSHSFAQGAVINGIAQDGNLVFTANQDGVDALVSPLDDSYTVEAGNELKITVYATDPDSDSISYIMNNKPDFAGAEFTEKIDGRAIFTWTPAEAEIGTYADITFIVSDGYQDVSSKTITINVVEKDVAGADSNTSL